jgi:hypothetical protein
MDYTEQEGQRRNSMVVNIGIYQYSKSQHSDSTIYLR